MRKDVKFGLTIGGILVVTLVIYVIVLSRGPAVPQRLGIALSPLTDQPASATGESNSPAHTNGEVAKADTNDQADANAPVTGDSTTSTPTTPQVTDGGGMSVAPTTSAPATQPATASNNAGDQWDNALNHGLPPTLSAPQRTETPTPTIDPTSTASASPEAPTTVTRPPTIPMIDPLPTTQPTRTQVASTPTIDPTPTPAPLYASAAPPPPASVSPAIPDSSSPAAPNTPRTHRIAAGESFYSIAQAVYGNGKYYKLILAANPKVDPHRLRIGQILVIPELNDADRAPARNSASVAPAAIDSSTQYVVASGDTLESISRKLYGTPAMIAKLYQMNRSVIGSDENVLKIGWVLKLPEAPTSNGSTGEVRGN